MKFSKPVVINKEIKENTKDLPKPVMDSIPQDMLTGRDLGDISGLENEVITFDHENLVWKSGDKLNFICNIVKEYNLSNNDNTDESIQ
jgi:hypothetical protein